ncbi:hypothetical protein D3C76_1705360 [compost metagenome]
MVGKNQPATLYAKLADIGIDEDTGCVTVAFMVRLRGLFSGMVTFAILNCTPFLSATLSVLKVDARAVVQRSLHYPLESC